MGKKTMTTLGVAAGTALLLEEVFNTIFGRDTYSLDFSHYIA